MGKGRKQTKFMTSFQSNGHSGIEVCPFTRGIPEEVLSNHLIMDEIFKNLHLSDILTCSILNLKWSAVCRNYLYLRRELYLKLTKLRRLSDLEDIAISTERFSQAGCHMFSGVKIRFSAGSKNLFNYGKFWEDTLDKRQLLQRIFGALETKHIVILLDTPACYTNRDEFHVNSSLFQLYITAVPMETLLSLKISSQRFMFSEFCDPLLENKFESLHSLCIEPGYDFLPDNNYVTGINAIVSACPSLKELLIPVLSFQVQYFVEANKVYLIKILKLWDLMGDSEIRFLELAGLRLRELISTSFRHKYLAQNIARIIRSSVETLKEVNLDLSSLEHLKSAHGKFPQLVNVTHLTIAHNWVWNTDDASEQRRLIGQQCKCNPLIRQIFPNLNIITLDSTSFSRRLY